MKNNGYAEFGGGGGGKKDALGETCKWRIRITLEEKKYSHVYAVKDHHTNTRKIS